MSLSSVLTKAYLVVNTHWAWGPEDSWGDVDSELCVPASSNLHSHNDSHHWNTSRTNFCANRWENHSYVNGSAHFNVTIHVRMVSRAICTDIRSALDSWMRFCELMFSSFCAVVVLKWSEFHLILLIIKYPSCCFVPLQSPVMKLLTLIKI